MGTQRTKAALDALFADNSSGAITPERLRDFVETMLPSNGGVHFDDPGSATTIGVAGTYVKAANTSTGHELYRFTHSNNRLTYTGTEDVDAFVIATASFTCASNNQVIGFEIAVNGSPITSSKIRTKIATGSDVQAITVIAHPTLAPGDYVEMWLTNETSTASVTVEHGHWSVLAHLT